MTLKQVMEDESRESSRVYTAEDIMKMLKIGRSNAYALLREAEKHKAPFKVVKIGKSVRAEKRTFDAWLGGYNLENVCSK